MLIFLQSEKASSAS